MIKNCPEGGCKHCQGRERNRRAMKLLLAAVNAKYIHTNLAVRDLRAYALSGFPTDPPDIEIAEYTINQLPREVLADIWSRHADLVAFSCYIWNIGYVETLIRDLRLLCPDTPIWAGGPEVSYHAEDFLRKNPGVTGVMTGEGEAAFAELAACCARGEACAHTDISAVREAPVPGIVFRLPGAGVPGEGALRRTPPAQPVPLDAIPFVYGQPDFDSRLFRHHILYYESSRGCPFHCSYCLSSLTGEVRFRSLDLVLPELQFFLDREVPQVKFVDRTFNCSHVRTKAIWQYLAEHDNGVTNFHFEIEADLLDEEEIRLLAGLRPGQVQLEIGVQSTNEVTLQEIRRHMDQERLRSVVRQTGITGNVHRHLDLIAGLPYEDYESFRKSFNDVYAMRPEQLQMGFLKVLNGSYMEKMAGSYDLVSQAEAPYEVLQTRWLSFAEIQKLKDIEEMLEVYGNSGQYRYAAAKFCELFSTPFDFFEALAAYHREKGLFGRKLSRIERLSVLREFWTQKLSGAGASGDSSEVLHDMEERLLLDLYLRENSRTRPAWAPDTGEGKTVFRAFYRRAAEEDRRLLPGYEGYDARQMAHMTHAEVFHTDVLGCGRPLPLYIVFDYRNRHPVTQDAALLFAEDQPEPGYPAD